MKMLGLLGGMSWESTVTYYRIINETVKERLGGLHSARIILASVDFHDMELLQRTGAWEEAGEALGQTGRSLAGAGAEALVLCTNTMHKVADAIERTAGIPLLHIADPAGEEIKRLGLRTVGLLGTRFTMEEEFYRGRLKERYGLDVLIPRAEDRRLVHRVIYQELCRGEVRAGSRAEYRRVIGHLARQGAEAVVLGCNEISMLVDQSDSPVPLFDTTLLHARWAAEWALGDAAGAALQGPPEAAPPDTTVRY